MPGGSSSQPVALVTGAGRRIGAAIARELHADGMRIAIHYHRSETQAHALASELNAIRGASAACYGANLLDTPAIGPLLERVSSDFGRLDALVNNASSFHATPLGATDEATFDDLAGTNFKAPYFLVQAAAPHLRATHGNVVNLVDIYASRPLAGHPVYSAAKAALVALTRSLAQELGPAVRVNAVAPGAILWPAGESVDEAVNAAIIARTALGRRGEAEEVARAVRFLIREATFTTGHVLNVDGGRRLED